MTYNIMQSIGNIVMVVFENDDYYIHCTCPTLWDVPDSGLTGRWRMNNFGNLELEVWYKYIQEKWIFWKVEKFNKYWVDEYDFKTIGKVKWSEYECNNKY